MSTTGQVVADWRIAEQSCRPGYGQAVWQRNMCVVPARKFPGDVGVCQSTALSASNLPASPSDLLPGVELLLPRCRPARAAVLQLVEVVAARQHTPVRLHTRAEPRCAAGQTTNKNRVRWPSRWPGQTFVCFAALLVQTHRLAQRPCTRCC